jgi:hypothetical protein
VDKASFCCSGGNHPRPTIADPRRSPTRHSRIRLKSGKFTGDQLQPILLALGSWGMEWSKSFMKDSDYDVELLMLYLRRSVVTENLPGGKTVVLFQFTDFPEQPKWWITAEGESVDVCTTDPGLDVDVFVKTRVRAMADAWLGRTSYKAAKASGAMEIIGPVALTRNISNWLSDCIFASLPNAEEILAGG